MYTPEEFEGHEGLFDCEPKAKQRSHAVGWIGWILFCIAITTVIALDNQRDELKAEIEVLKAQKETMKLTNDLDLMNLKND